VGYVGSGLARSLEIELGQALAQLKNHGLEAPVAAPTEAASPSPRKPAASGLKSVARELEPERPRPVATVAPLLRARLAGEDLGEVMGYEDGEVLYRRGERTEHLFIVLSGQLSLTEAEDGSGPRLLTVGQVLAEQGMFEEGLHSETVHASGAARILRMPVAPLQEGLKPDGSLLLPVMLSLVLQYRMISRIGEHVLAGQPPASYELLGQKTLTGPELHRALVEARSQAPGQGLSRSQQMCLQLQALEQLPTRLVQAGIGLGQPGQEHVGLGMLLVHGRAQATLGAHTVELGQGSVLGLAEGLTGADFVWRCSALQDLSARVFPIDRALQRLERADARLRGLAAHLCARILQVQADCA